MPESRVPAKRFALTLALGAGLLSVLPYGVGVLSAPAGASFHGFPFATDDHMVYSAWMRQAMDGNFLFDNRFAIDPQPGLTLHLYFWLLGLVAKAIGIPAAAAAARFLLSFALVMLLYRILRRVEAEPYFLKMALCLVAFGAGIGFSVWHDFGEAITRPSSDWLAAISGGGLPVDVWQPEAFLFPSMLTNSLFTASLCLILLVFESAVLAKDSWKPVAVGAVAMLMLMNIHSYDVVIVLATLVGLALASLRAGTLHGAWALRVGVIGLGAVPAAGWFVYVWQNDPVFQARAATDTFSPSFRLVVLGLLPLIALGIVGLRHLEATSRERDIALGMLGAGALALFALATPSSGGYWMGWLTWSLVFALALGLVAVLGSKCPWRALFASWAVVGLTLPYLPVLFQRKLSMGLALPWAALAAVGFYAWARSRDKGVRNILGALAIVVVCASSALWLRRELLYVRTDVSRTTVQQLYLSSNVKSILDVLQEIPGRKVVIAIPGVPQPGIDADGYLVPDRYNTPFLPDLNPFLSGFAGAYTFAGHWSETPHYLDRRARAVRFFSPSESEAERQALIDEIGATHVVAPVPEAFEDLYALGFPRYADVRSLGTVLVDGPQFSLIELRR